MRAKRLGLEVFGWLLVAGGIAALVLPGPGLLLIVAGLALLSQQYEWAERRLEPLKKKALDAAAEGVESWPRIVLSTLGAATLTGLGVLWIVRPDPPHWWPMDDKWWLVGGWGAGVSFILSALVAVALLVYSYRRFRSSSSDRRAA